MIKYRDYNKEKHLDRAWYDSSNIVYSECDDNENDFKTLRIVFKNGGKYEYKKVDVKDYLMFMAGGLDGSNGKAFYKFIRPKYEVEKLEPADLNLIETELQDLIKAKKEESKKEGEKTE